MILRHWDSYIEMNRNRSERKDSRTKEEVCWTGTSLYSGNRKRVQNKRIAGWSDNHKAGIIEQGISQEWLEKNQWRCKWPKD